MQGPLERLLFDPSINRDWHMQASERAALLHVLTRVTPDVSIEIGTFLGGSLRPIAAVSREVYTFDIDDRSIDGMPNVTFVEGDSSLTLPPIIDRINASDREINFMLIDGDHSEEGVKRDIVNCLRYRPKRRATVILMHDSCNPAVRKGIMDAPWQKCSFVHEVDLDFVNGLLFDREDIKGQMWGGLAAAIMLPETRTGPVPIHSPFETSRQAMIDKSIYAHN